MRFVVIGAGPGGYVAALKAAQLGAEVLVVEDAEVGGTCLNWGCIPTKALLASSNLYARVRQMDTFGIELEGSVRANMEKIMARKNKVVQTQVKGIRALFKSWDVTLVQGRGKLSGPRTVSISKRDGSEESHEADAVVVATGSRPAEVPAFPFDHERILSSDDAVFLKEIPRSLIIVGAGVIGCEFACIFRELGSDVTMVEMLPRAVATEDEEISDILARELKKKGIKLLTGVGVQEVRVDGDVLTAALTDGREIRAERMLVSVGRSLNSRGVGLEEAGVEVAPQGAVAVNDRMETTLPGVFAVGDVTGGALLAHKASREGIVAALNAAGQEARMDYGAVPSAIFTSPEIASVGLREFQAEEQGIPFRTGHFPFRALGKSHAMGEIAGVMKVVAHRDTHRVLGAHIIGPHASDLIHEAALAVRMGLTAVDVEETIHAHPTLSEGLMEAAGDVLGTAIHRQRP